MILVKRSVYILICIIFFSLLSYSQGNQDNQDNTDVGITLDYNLLLPSSAPAFTLLDISPETVERPGTTTDLIVTILNDTNNLDAIPENFALEFAPFWFSEKSKTAEYKSKEIWDTFMQTLSFSVATKAKSIDSDSNSEEKKSETSLGFGFRFSLLRGSIDNATIEQLKAYHQNYHNDLASKVKNDIEFQALRADLTKLLNELNGITDTTEKIKKGTDIGEVRSKMFERIAQIRKIHEEAEKDLIAKITALPIKRTGPKLDIAGGVVLDFPDKVFRDGELQRWGLWANGGIQKEKWGIFGIIRYLGNKSVPDTIDLGGRFVLDISEKFAFSAETLYRINTTSDMKNQWGFDGIFEYSIAKNKSIALVIGRDNRNEEPGGLVAKLALKAGFGSKRTL